MASPVRAPVGQVPVVANPALPAQAPRAANNKPDVAVVAVRPAEAAQAKVSASNVATARNGRRKVPHRHADHGKPAP